MDAFLQRRMSDGRYRLNTSRSAHSARSAPSTAVTPWYESTAVVPLPNASNAIVLASDEPSRFNASAAPFSKEEKKKLENRDTSDDSDAGVCYSDYERVSGTKPGEKGSCKPKNKKKKSDDSEKKESPKEKE